MEKDEITKMPERISSEELDNLTTDESIDDDIELKSDIAETEKDESLAQEALDATEESTPAEESVDKTAKDESETTEAEESEETEEEVDPKDAVIGGFRRKNRDLELENAKLQGQLGERQSIGDAPVEVVKSPLDKAKEAYIKENGDLGGFSFTVELYEQNEVFKAEQSQKKITVTAQEQANRTSNAIAEDLQENELSEAVKGKGLDFVSIQTIGGQYLTKGDELDISNISRTKGTKAALKEAYNILVRRTLTAGTADSKILQKAISVKAGKSQPKPKPKTGKTDIDALTTKDEDTEEGEAGIEVTSKKLRSFVGEEFFAEA